MSTLARFQQYADAFEEVFENDDWSLFEPYFTEESQTAVLQFLGAHGDRLKPL